MDLIPPAPILYEDNHLLIANKRATQIIQADKTGDKPLPSMFKDFIRDRDNKPGGVFFGVPHRLDRPVSGLVIFTKTSKALSRMSMMFRDGLIDKTYWAITAQKPEPETAHLVHYLRRNQKQNKTYITEPSAKDSQRAELIYSTLSSSDRYHLLQIKLLTGRQHQIRAQLSHIGAIIRGDMKYGYPRSMPDASICLHARAVSFIHPVSKESIEVFAPVPDEKLWKFFEDSVRKNKI